MWGVGGEAAIFGQFLRPRMNVLAVSTLQMVKLLLLGSTYVQLPRDLYLNVTRVSISKEWQASAVLASSCYLPLSYSLALGL